MSKEKRWSCLCETPVTVCVRKFTIRRIVDGERGRKRRDRIIPQLAFCCILQASVFLFAKTRTASPFPLNPASDIRIGIHAFHRDLMQNSLGIVFR